MQTIAATAAPVAALLQHSKAPGVDLHPPPSFLPCLAHDDGEWQGQSLKTNVPFYSIFFFFFSITGIHVYPNISYIVIQLVQ